MTGRLILYYQNSKNTHWNYNSKYMRWNSHKTLPQKITIIMKANIWNKLFLGNCKNRLPTKSEVAKKHCSYVHTRTLNWRNGAAIYRSNCEIIGEGGHFNTDWSAPYIAICCCYLLLLLPPPTASINNVISLGSCDRASWAKCEERETNKMQQLDVYY